MTECNESMEEPKRKRGRPSKESSRRNVLTARVTDESYEMLNFICEKEGWNKSQALREMIRAQYNFSKYKD